MKQILDNISLLPDEEFEELIAILLKESKLDAKQLVVNLYQKMHRDVYRKSDFEAFKPDLFDKEHFPELSMPRENRFMVWNDTLSKKYDREFNLRAITNRFENIKQCTYLTLENLKKDRKFPEFINALRNQGWKDWQIMSNIQNFMVNYKVQVLEGGEFPTEDAYVE
ncbi:hypothetical protein, partial [Pedobacter sp. ASV12]|uniref:hypothetical protein n=1 Tax=Pedobacter sp. ASV12 TaxID=2795120 RepID=UPI0018EA61A0